MTYILSRVENHMVVSVSFPVGFLSQTTVYDLICKWLRTHADSALWVEMVEKSGRSTKIWSGR